MLVSTDTPPRMALILAPFPSWTVHEVKLPEVPSEVAGGFRGDKGVEGPVKAVLP